MSVHRGQRRMGAGVYGHRESACCSWSRRVQRLRPGPADRDDRGQPGHRCAHQHLERPQRLHEPAGFQAGSSCTPRTPGALDLHIQAFKLAETVSLPVMVCMDGFILTHAVEEVEMPEQATVDAFLPAFDHARCSIRRARVHRAMVGPEAFTGGALPGPPMRQMEALEVIPAIAAGGDAIGRDGFDLAVPPRGRRDRGGGAGSVIGTLQDTVDGCASRAHIGGPGHHVVRPFPRIGAGRAGRRRSAVVLEKTLAVGIGGIVASQQCAHAQWPAWRSTFARWSPGWAAGHHQRGVPWPR